MNILGHRQLPLKLRLVRWDYLVTFFGIYLKRPLSWFLWIIFVRMLRDLNLILPLVLAILSKEVWAVLHVSHTLERWLIIHRHPDIIVGHFGCLLLNLVLTAYEDVELAINLVLLDTILALRALMLVKKGETAVLPTFNNISVLVFLHEFVRFLLKILVHLLGGISRLLVWHVPTFL